MRRIKLIVVAAALAGFAACAAPKPQTFSFKHSEFRATLPNGLKLVIMPDSATPLVQVDVRYHVGANEDPPGKAGLAHYVEHMMFQWRMFGEDGPPLFDIIPQYTTIFNAYTSMDRTHYWLKAPKESLEKLLAIESHRMNAAQGCPGSIPMKEFPRELDVVRNEIRRGLGQASGLIIIDILKALYPDEHPYHHTPGGTDENLVEITPEDVCKFMKDYYVPNRATLIVAGNVDPDEVGKLAMRYFKAIPRKEAKKRREVAHVETKKMVKTFELDIERPIVAVAWSMPPMTDKEFIKGQIAASMLNLRLSMFNEKYNFAASAVAMSLDIANGAASGAGPKSPMLVAFVELKDNEEKTRKNALKWLWKAAGGAHRFAKSMSAPGQEDVKRQKAYFIMGLETLDRRTEEVAHLIQFGKLTEFDGTSDYLLDKLKDFDNVESADYAKFVKTQLSKDRATTLIFKANSDGRKGDKRSADRLAKSADFYSDAKPIISPEEAQVAAKYPAKPGIIATTETYTLGNGMEVMLLPKDGMPILNVSLRFGVGSVHEDPNDAGLAEMAADFLRQPMDSNVTAKLGIRTRSRAGSTSTTFGVSGITLYTSEMLKALERLIIAGEYVQTSIESFQKAYKQQSELESSKRDFLRAMTVSTELYGAEHPYTTTGSVTPESFKRFGMDKLNKFSRKHYVASNATLIVVGKFDTETIKSDIDRVFGGFRKGEPATTEIPAAAPSARPAQLGFIHKDEQNTNIGIYYPGPAGMDDKYAERMMISRLLRMRMGNVRTKLGTTYGVSGGWGASVGPSVYQIGGIVETMHAAESLKLMRQEIAQLREGKNLAVDFVRARRGLMKQLLGSLTTVGRLSGQLSWSVGFGTSMDHTWKTMKAVATMKPEAVLEVMKRELDPANELLTLTAHKEGLETTYKALGMEYKLVDIQ